MRHSPPNSYVSPRFGSGSVVGFGVRRRAARREVHNRHMGWTERNGRAAPLRIVGRYRLVGKLGVGGMSVVWRGYDEGLGRPVAVKGLSPRLADDQAFRDRLRQEALAAARLTHPHITGIFDFGETPLYGRFQEAPASGCFGDASPAGDTGEVSPAGDSRETSLVGASGQNYRA